MDFQWNLESAVNEILAVLKAVGIDQSRFGPHPDYAALFNITRDVTKDWDPTVAGEVFKRLDRIYDSHDQDALSRWQLYPGTEKTLTKVATAGYRMGVVSNCGKKAVSGVLERFNLLSCFELILSRNDVAYLKPEPGGLVKAAERLNLPFNRILFVGDSLNDILPANHIDMPSCFVCGGESRVTGEKNHHATFEISCLPDLVPLLENDFICGFKPYSGACGCQ